MDRPVSRNPRFAIRHERTASCTRERLLSHLLYSTVWPRWQPEIVETTGPAKLAAGDVVEGHATMMGFQVAGRTSIEAVGDGYFVENAIVGVGMRIRYDV